MRAILLVAGRARRMGALAEDRPKCLLEVAGVPILERACRSLARIGITDVSLVVGYRSDHVRRFAERRLDYLELNLVHNDDFGHTNTAYSLWLARHRLRGPTMLLEGDILFDPRVLRRVVEAGAGDRSVWAGVPVSSRNDEGILLERSARGDVVSVELVREPDRRGPHLEFKCAGIQVLRPSLARAFAARLDRAVRNGGRSLFADLVLGDLLDQHAMQLFPVDPARWAEVDDPGDLRQARSLFEGEEANLARAAEG